MKDKFFARVEGRPAGRPRCEIRQAFTVAAAELGAANYLQIAQHARLSAPVATRVAYETVRNMVRAGDLHKTCEREAAVHSRRPLARYVVAPRASASTAVGAQALEDFMRRWRR